jgi:hypothetical protein
MAILGVSVELNLFIVVRLFLSIPPLEYEWYLSLAGTASVMITAVPVVLV